VRKAWIRGKLTENYAGSEITCDGHGNEVYFTDESVFTLDGFSILFTYSMTVLCLYHGLISYREDFRGGELRRLEIRFRSRPAR
jgi:hypothetical protein